MVDYTFSTLNDKEFENLSIHLLSSENGKRFQRFKAGRDQGIDGAYYHSTGLEEVVQCKHYLNTGLKGLLSSLKKKNDKGINEIEKVKKLNPKKYIFITSLSLSSKDKENIKDLFIPFIKNCNDIYGQEDLNDLIKRHSEVEKNHYKLWLSSSNVLVSMLNNAIEGRSESYLEDINEKLRFYVNTTNHKKALSILRELNTLIITGEPGIGKSTLAENLCYFYSSQGYKFYLINKDIEEVEKIYLKDTKQVFYFDDFLGSNFLKAIENKQDSSIVQFIKRVKKDKDKKFILTSRTNIFSQAQAISSTFKSKNIDDNEFTLTINSLTDYNKAEILYNHLWFSSLPKLHIDMIYENKRYMQIINHKNFNPRLIEFLTNKNNAEDIKPSKFWDYVLNTLNNPSEVWSHTFDCQSDDYIRNIILLIVFNGNEIDEKILKESYSKLNEISKASSTTTMNTQFDSVIRTTVKYFVNRNLYSNDYTSYTLFNPSLADFIIYRYKNEIEFLKSIYLSLSTSSSISNLKSLEKNGFFSNLNYNLLLNYLFNQYDMKAKKVDYFLNLSLLIIKEKNIDNQQYFHSKIKIFLDTTEIKTNITRFLELLVFATKELNYKIDLVELISNNYICEINDLPHIIDIYNNLELDDNSILTNFNARLEDVLVDELSDLANSELDISEYITIEENYNIEINEISLKDALHSLLEDLIVEYDTSIINIDTDDIVDSVDLDKLTDSYFSGQDSEYDEDSYRERQVITNDIDELFERSC